MLCTYVCFLYLEFWGSVRLSNSFDIPIFYKWEPGKDEMDYNRLYPITTNGMMVLVTLPKYLCYCMLIYLIRYCTTKG